MTVKSCFVAGIVAAALSGGLYADPVLLTLDYETEVSVNANHGVISDADSDSHLGAGSSASASVVNSGFETLYDEHGGYAGEVYHEAHAEGEAAMGVGLDEDDLTPLLLASMSAEVDNDSFLGGGSVTSTMLMTGTLTVGTSEAYPDGADGLLLVLSGLEEGPGAGMTWTFRYWSDRFTHYWFDPLQDGAPSAQQLVLAGEVISFELEASGNFSETSSSTLVVGFDVREVESVPEPATWTLVVLGAAAMIRRRGCR